MDNEHEYGDAEYQQALENSRLASRVFALAQKAYRARQINDAVFLTAKADHDAAMLTFDAAYAKAIA